MTGQLLVAVAVVVGVEGAAAGGPGAGGAVEWERGSDVVCHALVPLHAFITSKSVHHTRIRATQLRYRHYEHCDVTG